MKVHPIRTGSVFVRTRQREGMGPGRARLVATLFDREWTEPLPIYAWLVEHPEGLILIDTGETSRVQEPGYFPRWHPYYRLGVRGEVKPDEEIGPRLRQLGFSPDDVDKVVMTHLHTDHAGGLAHFPNSEILIARREFETASGFTGRLQGYLPNRWPEWLSPTLFDLEPDAYGPFPQSLPVTDAGDLRIVGTPGHTNAHVSVVLEEDGRSIFFAGDTSYTEELMTREAVDGVGPNPRAAKETVERIHEFTRQRPVVYLPTHDPDSAARLEARQAVAG